MIETPTRRLTFVSLSIALSLLSFLLWLYTMSQCGLSIGDFGLIQALPVTYFISAGLLTAGFIVVLVFDTKNWKVLFSQTILLIAFLKMTPIFIEWTARPSWARFNFGFTEYVLRTGHVNSSQLIYHNWPGFSILSSTLTAIMGTENSEIVLMMFPFLINVLLLFSLLLFFGVLFKGDEWKIWVGVWLFYLANWVGQDYFSSQSISLILYITVVALALKGRDFLKSKSYFAVFMLLFATIVLTHSLTAIYVLIFVFALFMLRYGVNFKLVSLFAFLFVAWNIYGGEAFLRTSLIKYMPSLNFGLVFHENVLERLSGSEAHVLVGYSRILLSLVILGFAFLGFLRLVKLKKKINRVILLALVAPILLLPTLSYGGEQIFRVFLICLAPLLYFIAHNLDSKKVAPLIFILLIILTPVHILTYYGTETYEHVSSAEIHGAAFSYSTLSNDSIIVYRDCTLDFKNAELYERILFRYHELSWEQGVLVVSGKQLHADKPLFVWLTTTDKRWYDFYVGNLQLLYNASIGLASWYNKIYSNPDFESYSRP